MTALAFITFNTVNAQYKDLPASIDVNTTLESGNYLVKGTSTINNSATLKINKGTNLYFEESARIHVQGGIDIAGAPNDFIEITSLDKDRPGIGFVFTEASNTNISFRYSRIHQLVKPIKINKNWSRKSITIENNQFFNLHHSGVYIEIQELDKIITDNLVTITLYGNTFSNNSGSILLSEASSDLLKVNISNNVFSRNEYIGRDLNGIFTTPLFMNYNMAMERGREPVLVNNSICYNYGSLMLEDTVEFFPTHLTVVGNADFLSINQNYFGDQAEQDFDVFMDQLSSSQRAPLLIYNKLSTKPESNLNGHIYKIGVNGIRIDNLNNNVAIDGQTDLIELVANRPITTSPDFKITYVHLEDDTLRYEALEHKLDFSSGNMKVEITIKDRIIKMRKYGYIKIEGFIDQNGFLVPVVSIGLKNFLIENRIFVMGYNDFVKIPKLIQSTPRMYYPSDMSLPPGVASDTGDFFFTNENNDPEDSLLREKYWDFGVLAGTTMYFGDLAYTNVTLYLPNARPNIGFRIGYSLNERLRLELTQNNMVIAGADDRTSIVGKNRGTNYDRGLSFRTWIYDIGISGEYRLSKFRKTKSVVPSIYTGVSGFYFNPQGEVDGVYYPLRPLGTEGQTADGSRHGYSRFGIAIPSGIKLTRHLNNHTLISVSYTYNKLFTDYLDDVSTGYFQTDEDLINNNPDLGSVAIKLANPNGKSSANQRSSSADYDGYSFFGVTITRKL